MLHFPGICNILYIHVNDYNKTTLLPQNLVMLITYRRSQDLQKLVGTKQHTKDKGEWLPPPHTN